ncbi:MAG: hypothetical protein LUG99_08915 [Lachnospiraceae bacterium]|nr:hypothetical protein [Lachnospiraceae bacterium]
MKINYQIMTDKQGECYIPDYNALIANATCEEEAEYIQSVEEQQERMAAHGFERGFRWNMVYVTRQSCGHFEIFQTPCNEYHTLQENLQIAEGHSKERCTKCICGWSWKKERGNGE